MPLVRRLLVSFGALALTLGGLVLFYDLVILNSHDDPVVVDNGPIRVARDKATPEKDGHGRRWAIHHSARLKLLHAYSRRASSGKWLPLETPLPLTDLREIVFRLVAKPKEEPTKSMTIFRDQFGEQWPWDQAVRLDPEFDFEWKDDALTPAADYQGYRIGEIRFGRHVICLAEADRPLPRACSNFDNPPDEIRVLLCAEDDKCGRRKPKNDG
jgi:hypothetical protein